MIITVVCDVLGEPNNGTTIAAFNLINSLKSKGHEVRVICPDADKKGIKNYYIVPTFNVGPLNNYVKKNGVSLAKADKKIILEAIIDADIIHIMLPFNLGIKTVKLAKKLHKPVTAGFHAQAENITNHIFMMNVGIANKVTYKAFYSKLYKRCDAIHYPTEFIKDTFEKAINKKTNGYVISNGVNKRFVKKYIEKNKELKGKKVILFTGRYSKEKSHIILIQAVQKSKYYKDIQLIFAGKGPLEEKLKLESKNLINQPIFKFYSRDELVNIINMSDLYVHPAEIEIEAISCLEAISCGIVPIISNSERCATKSFAIDEKNTFECNNPQSLADKIDYWFDNPKEKEKRSNDYLGYTEKFRFEKCMDKMEEMLIKTYNNYKKSNSVKK